MNQVGARQTNKGIIGLLVLLIIALLSISYFGISLKGIVDSPTGQSNFGYVRDLSVGIWSHYLEKPATYLYNDVFIKLIWTPFIGALEDLKAGRPTAIDPPKVDLGQ
jgi:hypothetical protein